MAGDYTRITFDPLLDRAMVFEQQGRVHLDADFNELVSILERRLRVETYDFTGPAVVPAQVPQSFEIKLAGTTLTIGPGRMYVDGLLAENHGYGKPIQYEPVWDEPEYQGWTPLDKQPYLGSPVPSKVTGNQLAYLDVWPREETYVEDPSMLESALGVDTCTRVQTAWQVKLLQVEPGVTCSSEIPNFPPPPSAGRLTSRENDPPAPADPCAVAPVGGYRGLENRLYRVEIHDGGDLNTATFKWSRDNGGVASIVTAVDSAAKPQVITVELLGRDQVLRFHTNEWVELLDDTHELDGKPGLTGQVKETDPTTNTVTLYKPMTGPIDLARNPRLRRWDQQDGVNANGVIPVTPAPAGGFFKLEDGVEVKLDLSDPAGQFKTGDWWAFWARAAIAQVEHLEAAPPRGIRHHYAKLAVIQSGKVVGDCRVQFPGKCECEGDSCECAACVTPESHASGALTIQAAIDKVTPTGGRVCLAPGQYPLRAPLRIEKARSLTLAGAGSATMITYQGEEYGILVQDSVEVSLERFALAVEGPRIGIALANTAAARVERCLVLVGLVAGSEKKPHFGEFDVGIGLAGWALGTRLLENVVLATHAISDAIGKKYLASVDLRIVDNLLLGLQTGIVFGGSSNTGQQAGPAVHLGWTRIGDNLVIGGQTAGIVLAGIGGQQHNTSGDTVPVSVGASAPVTVAGLAALELGFGEIEVTGNALIVGGDGVRAAPDTLRIADNQMLGSPLQRASERTVGVRLGTTRDAPVGQARVTGNLIRGFGRGGFVAQGSIGSLTVSSNRILDVGTFGVGLEEVGFGTDVTIAENVISRVAVGPIRPSQVAAIYVAMAGDVRVSGNVVRQVGSTEWNGSFLYGIDVTICNVGEVSGNVLTEIGPRSGHGGWVIGIGAARYLTTLDVRDNAVTLATGGDGSRDTPVLIGEPPTESQPKTVFKAMAIQPRWQPNLAIAPATAPVAEGAVPMAPGQPDLSVRGNTLAARGIESVVLVNSAANVLLAENRCWRQNGKQIRAVVAVQAEGATIVSSNRVEGARMADESVAINLQVDASTQGVPHCTVLGNIADGDIDLNGAVLAAPWAPLNIHA